MNRTLSAAVVVLALTASVAGAATGSSQDRQQGLVQKVNSIGWGARVSRDRYPYAYGFEDDGYATTGAPVEGYVDEQQPVYRHAYRPAVHAAPYGYDPDDE